MVDPTLPRFPAPLPQPPRVIRTPEEIRAREEQLRRAGEKNICVALTDPAPEPTLEELAADAFNFIQGRVLPLVRPGSQVTRPDGHLHVLGDPRAVPQLVLAICSAIAQAVSPGWLPCGFRLLPGLGAARCLRGATRHGCRPATCALSAHLLPMCAPAMPRRAVTCCARWPALSCTTRRSCSVSRTGGVCLAACWLWSSLCCQPPVLRRCYPTAAPARTNHQQPAYAPEPPYPQARCPSAAWSSPGPSTRSPSPTRCSRPAWPATCGRASATRSWRRRCRGGSAARSAAARRPSWRCGAG